MLEKVFYMNVLVSDQDKALDFYTNVLGLEKRVENPAPEGSRFLTVVLEFPWGYVAQFRDPDGNVLQLREGR